jgi:hypothetical protein
MTIQDKRIVGGIGLHHTCCQIARRGWIVDLTRRGWKHISRNISGVDIIIRNKDSKELTIQIIVALNSEPIPFGDTIDNLAADFVIFCRSVGSDKHESSNHVRSIPEIFIMAKEEITSSIIKRTDNDKISYWLKESEYNAHKDEWKKIGFA